MKYTVRPHAFGWAVIKHDTPGGTVVETCSSRSTAQTVAASLNADEKQKDNEFGR